jgi:hypothetical protein
LFSGILINSGFEIIVVRVLFQLFWCACFAFALKVLFFAFGSPVCQALAELGIPCRLNDDGRVVLEDGRVVGHDTRSEGGLLRSDGGGSDGGSDGGGDGGSGDVLGDVLGGGGRARTSAKDARRAKQLEREVAGLQQKLAEVRARRRHKDPSFLAEVSSAL